MQVMQMDVGSKQWEDMMINKLGLKKEWLKYYGSHFELEKLDNECNYDKINKLLNENIHKKLYLLNHIAMTRGCFGKYNCENYLSDDDKKLFDKMLDDVLKRYGSKNGK
jgi:hypothetical protein